MSDLPKWEDLKIGKTLGQGAFGRVTVAYYAKNVWACKGLRKSAIVQMQQTHHIINEKNCLQAMESPFILQVTQNLPNLPNLSNL